MELNLGPSGKRERVVLLRYTLSECLQKNIHYRAARRVVFAIVENGYGGEVQILYETVFLSVSINALGKVMSQSLLHPVMGK